MQAFFAYCFSFSPCVSKTPVGGGGSQQNQHVLRRSKIDGFRMVAAWSGIEVVPARKRSSLPNSECQLDRCSYRGRAFIVLVETLCFAFPVEAEKRATSAEH